jgi:hypothetical protein
MSALLHAFPKDLENLVGCWCVSDLPEVGTAAEKPADRQLVQDNNLALAIANVHGNDDSDDVVRIRSVIQSSTTLTSSQVSSMSDDEQTRIIAEGYGV